MLIRRLIFLFSFLVFWTAVLAGVLVVGLSTTRGLEWLRQGVEWTGNKYLNGNVSIGRLEGNLWRSMRVYDLSMTLPDSLGGYEVVGAREGELVLDPFGLLGSDPVVSCVTVDGLRVFYNQGVGPRSWDSMGVLFGMDHESSGAPGPPRKIMIPDLQVRRGQFRYLDTRDPNNVIEIDARDISLGSRLKNTEHIGGTIESGAVAFLINGLQDSVSHAHTEFKRKGDRLLLSNMTFQAASGPELTFEVNGELSSIQRRTISLDINGDGDVGAIARLIGIEGSLQGPFHVTGTMENSLEKPAISASLESPGMHTGIGYISSASLGLTFEDGVLNFEHYQGDSEAGRIGGDAVLDMSAGLHRYKLHLAPSTLNLETLPTILFGEDSSLSGTMVAALDISGSGWDSPELEGRVALSGEQWMIADHAFNDFTAKASYDNGKVILGAESSVGALSARGNLTLNGAVDLKADLFIPDASNLGSLLGGEAPEGLAEFTMLVDGDVGRPSVWFDGQISDLGYAGLTLGTLMVTGAIDRDRIGRLDAYLDTTKIHLSLEADLAGDLGISGRIDMADLTLRDYVNTQDDLGLDAHLDLQGRIEGSLRHPVIRGEGLLRDFTLRGENLGNTSVALRLEDKDLSFTLVKPDFSVISDGLITLDDSYPFDIRLDVKRANLSPLLAILAERKIERHTGRFTGKLHAVGFAEYPDLSTITVALDSLIMAMDDQEIYFASPATLKLDRQLVTIDRLELIGDLGHVMLNGVASLEPEGLLDVEALFEGVQIDFLSPFLLPRGNVTGTADGFFSLTGSPESPLLNGLFSTADMQYSNEGQVNQLGTVSLSMNYDEQEFRVPALSLSTPLGSASASIAYPIDLSWGGTEIDTGDREFTASLDMDHLSVAPLRNFFPSIPMDLDGTINGHVTVNGPVARPEDLAGTISLDSLRLFGLQNELVNEDSLMVRFNSAYADLDPARISLRRLNQTSVGLGTLDAGGRIAFQTKAGAAEESDFLVETQDFSLEALQALMGQDLAVSGSLNSNLEISGTGAAKSWDASIKLVGLKFNEAAVDSIDSRVVYEYGDLIIHDFQTWFKDRTLVAYGTIPFDPDRADGTADMDNMAITVEGEDLDLSFLSGILYDIEQIKGRADVQLTVGGTPFAPRSVGEILIEDASIKGRDFSPPLRASRLEFRVDGDEFSLQPVELEAGKGSIYAFSRMVLENFGLSSYEVHATLNKANIERIGSSKLVADGSLSLTGDRRGGQLSGTSLSATGIITHPLNLGEIILGTGDVVRPQAAPDPLLENIVLDVEIDIPRLRIRNALADLEIEGGIAFSGTAQNPVITGNAATLDNGTIEYLDTKFEVETGRIEFLNRTPLESFTSLIDYPLEQTNPEVTMRAQASRVRDIYGGEYDVALNLSGRALQPNLELVATPTEEGRVEFRNQNALFGPQVVSLLTFGLPGMKADTETFTGIGNRALLMATGSQAEKLLRLDEVRIEGDVLNNNTEAGSAPQITVSKWVNRRTRVTYTRLFDSSEYQLRVGYQLSNFLFIETFTDQIGERPQNGMDLKLKFRFR
ncbi:MAG: hypothetical protein HOH43_18495 [Candidatus Latescibacteria bacterium]|jgi:hypothetical protein|nr:hypothetical protein [Candidatus Latescibacterota bacterium]